MMAGRIDLTVGFGIVMWHILAISLQVNYGVPWPLAILVVVACGALVGLINGVLVEVAQVDSFIATLGTGTILYALALWHTDGRQIIGDFAAGLHRHQRALDRRHSDAGRLCASCSRSSLWIVSERLPIGRHIYAIGANEKAAALNGIPVRMYVIGVFVASGVIAGLAGCVLAREAAGSAKRMSGSTICCRRWSAPSSARRRSSPGGSMSGAPYSASSYSRSASPASSSSAALFSSSPCSMARRWSSPSRSPAFAQRRRSAVARPRAS